MPEGLNSIQCIINVVPFQGHRNLAQAPGTITCILKFRFSAIYDHDGGEYVVDLRLWKLKLVLWEFYNVR